jgi:flagellar protein FlaI
MYPVELPAPEGAVILEPLTPNDQAAATPDTMDPAEPSAPGENVTPEGTSPDMEPEAPEIKTKTKRKRFNIGGRIKQVFSPKHESIDPLGFELGEISTPVLGVALREVDITYEVNPPFQYVNIRYEDEELIYHIVEPLLSDSEVKYLAIIENAFEKMIHSDIVIISDMDREEYLRNRFSMIINIYLLKLDHFQKEKMFYHLLKKYIGFGKIDIMMKDPYIEDITCNGPDNPVYINHRIYGSIRSDVTFEEVELNNFVMKIAQTSGRHISVLQPIRDATLTDGSRINLTLGREVTRKGSTFTIRRFRSNPVSPVDLIKYGTFDSKQLAYLWIILEYKRSILTAGGTASGKTTTLNALCAFIRPEYKIVSIEDTAELNLMHPNWTQSITRTGFGGEASLTKSSGSGGGSKSAGDIELYDLLVAALRQRPEYIVVGEVRGSEAFTLFQAISVGHPCLGTIHAGSMKELLSRVESNPMNVPRSLFSSVDNIIFSSMIKKGEHYIRRASNIVEIIELDPDRGDLITNPIFRWDPVSDTFAYSGSCALFAGIRKEFGVPEGYLFNELKDRAQLLDYLSENNITDYESVANAIKMYSRQKDAMMEKMD